MPAIEHNEDDEREADDLRLWAYEAWASGGGPTRSDMDDLALRAAAQHAQIIGDATAERQIDGILAAREARRSAR